MLTWILLALIPLIPVILALVPGLDEPRNEGEPDAPLDRDDMRLDDPPGEAGQDEAGPVLMAA